MLSLQTKKDLVFQTLLRVGEDEKDLRSSYISDSPLGI